MNTIIKKGDIVNVIWYDTKERTGMHGATVLHVPEFSGDFWYFSVSTEDSELTGLSKLAVNPYHPYLQSIFLVKESPVCSECGDSNTLSKCISCNEEFWYCENCYPNQLICRNCLYEGTEDETEKQTTK